MAVWLETKSATCGVARWSGQSLGDLVGAMVWLVCSWSPQIHALRPAPKHLTAGRTTASCPRSLPAALLVPAFLRPDALSGEVPESPQPPPCGAPRLSFFLLSRFFAAGRRRDRRPASWSSSFRTAPLLAHFSRHSVQLFAA